MDMISGNAQYHYHMEWETDDGTTKTFEFEQEDDPFTEEEDTTSLTVAKWGGDDILSSPTFLPTFKKVRTKVFKWLKEKFPDQFPANERRRRDTAEISTTVTGKQCQMWNSQSPHDHQYRPSAYPNWNLIKNYCRGMDADFLWCYTTDSNSRWEKCSSCPNPSCFDRDEEIDAEMDASLDEFVHDINLLEVSGFNPATVNFGKAKPDVDECATNTDNCDINAKCENTIGSFTCSCNIGFQGNGEICNGSLNNVNFYFTK